MTLLIAILSILFIVLTFMVVSKTQAILKGLTKSEVEESEYLGAPDKFNSANGVGLFAFWIISIVGIIWSFIVYKKDFLPEASSVHGKETDYWFWVSMIVIMIGFFIVNTFLFLFSYLYRHNKNRKVTFYTHNNNLEIIWTTVPAIVMAGLVFSGLRVWTKITSEAPANAEQIDIMGKQFGWTVRYAGVDDNQFGKYNYKLMDDAGGNPMGVDFSDPNSFDDFSNASEMHIPKGKPVLLKIRARDVLHSVFIPHMRVKMDAVPGMPTKFWFVADKSTADMRAELGKPEFNYEIACTEICGRSHFGMKLLLVVDEPADYEKWKKSQKPLLTENPDLLNKVPDNLKAKAQKYVASDEPAVEVVPEVVASRVLGNSSKVLK
ncbi:cytochrome c oxidase subunit II [Lacihabitans sp. CS3-21]|jgi:cytochrome c oxidase subunit 2|uniref:cytochrome c oxidase subunit II n=1 Tax=Lacihabitans sp. CS3-21 TaxID=2487332 RepID=UPI000BD15776|nr:cytochrome c oxidase subunit II [Lacihabitans sp. CS3-21]MCP9745700.1 cytochrome c oxidase subunit II [Lacihabitans sp. CS3-21]MDP1813978.1 cytochrome c oxidase subunit II [Leadbetterella sp.]OYU67183.1 MAG: cytochrome C oxidase subunit II [Cytophagaceae bacterium BCCC1]